MYKNYLKIAFRNLIKHRMYAFLNVAGLAIGLTCFISVSYTHLTLPTKRIV